MGSVFYVTVFLGRIRTISHPRYLSLSCAHSSKQFSKQGKILNKLISGSSKKRKFFFDDSRAPSSEMKFGIGKKINSNKENCRRIAVLNALFMKHISELLVTGGFGIDLLGKGLEISRVSMNSNFNQLNVFWGTNNEKNIGELETILPDVGFTLRHELTQLRVMGVVPRIVFVKDKHYNTGAKVDYLLQIADFGEDHVPVELESDFKNPSSVAKCSPKEKSQTLSGEQTADEKTNLADEEVMPLMRQDIFNLDHQRIMEKIIKKIHKSRAYHRYEPNLAIQTDGKGFNVSNTTDVDKMSKEDRKEALAKFILSRRIIQEKKKQNKHKSDIDLQSCILQQNDNEDDEYEDFEVEDYIEEDENEEQKYNN